MLNAAMRSYYNVDGLCIYMKWDKIKAYLLGKMGKRTEGKNEKSEDVKDSNKGTPGEQSPSPKDFQDRNVATRGHKAKKFFANLALPVAASVISIIAIPVINTVYIIPYMHQYTEKTIDDFKNDVNNHLDEYREDYKNDIKEVKDEIDDISNDISDNNRDLNKRIDSLYDLIGELLNSKYMSFHCDELFAHTLENSIGKEDGPFASGLSYFSSATVTAVNDGKKYTGADLDGQPIFVSHKEGDKEIFFCGYLNDEGLYDGNCLFNTYEDGKLVLISDATYDSGKMLNYRQAYTFTTARNELVWAISRKIEGNKGEVWTYYYQDIEQNFTYEDAKASDVFTIEGFEELISEFNFILEGYYFGRTTDGRFNDTSGESYMVKYYKEDYTVRTLYYGGFQDGRFYDQTGDAWMIGKKKIDQDNYAYYKGLFENNTYVENGGIWKYNLTSEDISGILEQYDFNCPLNGLASTQEDMENSGIGA